MTQVSFSHTPLTCAFAGTKLGQACPSPLGSEWTHYLDLFRQDIDSRFKIDKVYEITLTIPEAARASPSQCEPIPTTPLLLSPTSSASSPRSTRKNDFTWDSPQTPQTPLQQKFRADLDLATPLTPPEPFEGTLKKEVVATELSHATPSRTGASYDGSHLEEHTQGTEVSRSSIRSFSTMLQSSKNDDAVGSSSSLPHSSMPSNDLESESFELRPELSHSDVNNIANTVDLALSRAIQKEPDVSATILQQDPHRNERNDHALRTSVVFKTALRDSKGHELEGIFSAIERRSRTDTSGSKEVEFRPEVATIRDRSPTQPPAELRFNFQSLPNHSARTTLRFDSKYDTAFGEGTSQGFIFAANDAGQVNHETRAATPHVETENSGAGTTTKTCQEVPHGCKKDHTLLEQILPFEINTRLIDDPNRCVATQVKAMIRCVRVRQVRPNAVKATVDAIRSCVDDSDYSHLPYHIERLMRAVMCPLHQTVALRKNIANPRMNQLRDLISTLPQRRDDIVTIFANWLQAIIDIDTLTSLSHAKPSKPSPPRLSKFAPYHAKGSDECHIAKALNAKVSESLTDEDKKDGFIYMFWDQQNFGMIKVGRTIDLEQRLKQWNAQCKITHHYHQSSQEGEPLRIPHCQRIERLMHIELRNYRKKRTCDGCGTTHLEWFDISAEKAKKVYQKWQDWILQKPYAQDDAGNWVIRPEMLDTLSQVCKPVTFSDTIVTARPRQSLPKTRVRRPSSSALR